MLPQVREAFVGLLSDATTRILKRERRDVLEIARKAFKRDAPQALRADLEAFYANHEGFITDALAGPSAAYGRAIGNWDAGQAIPQAARRHIEATDNAIRAVLESENPTFEAVEALFSDEMLAKRAQNAGNELIEALSTE